MFSLYSLKEKKVTLCFFDSGKPASWMRVHTCVCVHACNGCAATVSVWVVYGSYCAPSSCSSVSHVTGWAFVIGWERNWRGGNAGMDVRREEVRGRGGVRGSEASNVGCKPYTKRSEWGLHNQLNTLGPHSYTANRISAANRAPYDFSYWLTSYKSPNSALFHSKYSKFYTDYALLCVSCEIKPIKSNGCFS